jgi:pimeloyl-ACP methyl ester carboxylesterase
MTDDVIVLLPGILGSALSKNGDVIWDASTTVVGRAILSGGASLQELALAGDTDTGTGVTATHLLSDVHIVPFFWKIDGYSGLSEYLQDRLDARLGENFFEFPYDWRLDNRISAQRLADAAGGWLEQRRKSYPKAKLSLIAHSMGGLVARYFIEVLGGWRDTRMLITLGTPHRGALKALDYLANGRSVEIGPVHLLDLWSLIASLPSVRQLLPIYPCVSIDGQALQRLEEIDRKTLGRLDVERARAGIAFHREIEKAVEVNRKDPSYGYRIVPIVGMDQPTPLSAELVGDYVKPLDTYEDKPATVSGDGTVPSFSATPIELAAAGIATFVSCPHSNLQNFDPARTDARAKMLQIDDSGIKAVRPDPISLNLRDAFSVGEAFVTRARCANYGDALRAVLTHADTSATSEHEFTPEPGASGWQRLELPSLPAGTYRLRVDAGPESEAINDVFIVTEATTATSITKEALRV